MIAVIKRIVGLLAIGVTCCGTAVAASSPIGVWIDHTGRGAVEITDCGGNLCGRLVWFKEAKNSREGCNFQIMGDVKPVAGGKWDNGWIIDPEKDPDKKYDVEITVLSDQKLKVMGYAGMKFLSETMTWTRAPVDLKKCGEDVANPGVDPKPNPTEETPRREVGRDPELPVTKEAPPEVDKPAKRDSARQSKDCKVEFAGVSITLPCKDLE
jgi:uncharacterized protein (DUF2147 family)